MRPPAIVTTIAPARDNSTRPTQVRMIVVGLAILLGMVTYLQRACLGTLETPIMADLALSKAQLSYVHTAFALAYAGFGIASAWWGDRVGTRLMLTIVVVVWSCCTFATGLAQGLISLIAIRFVFGVGESGAWPSITRTLSRWIPYAERGRAQGIVWIGAHIAAGLTPLLVDELLRGVAWHGMRLPPLTWRGVLMVFSFSGLVWAVVWYWWFRDEPAEHRQVNAAELAHITAGRSRAAAGRAPQGWAFWKRLLTHRNILALSLMYIPNSYVFYFCITWFHKYLQEGRGLQGRTLALFTGLPLLLSVVADMLGGAATDWAVRRYGPRWGRAGVGFVSYATAGVCMLLAAVTRSAPLAATLFALGTAANMFLLGAAWGTCQDIGGGHAGAVSATMNTAGQIGPVICPLLVIYLAERWHNWDLNLVVIGVGFLVAAFCWGFIDPREKVFD